jgi:hypothetical protein
MTANAKFCTGILLHNRNTSEDGLVTRVYHSAELGETMYQVAVSIPSDSLEGRHVVSDWAESTLELSDNAVLKALDSPIDTVDNGGIHARSNGQGVHALALRAPSPEPKAGHPQSVAPANSPEALRGFMYCRAEPRNLNFFKLMADKKFDELQRDLELAVWELRVAKDPEQRRYLLHEMSRLITEVHRIIENPKPKPKP